MVDIMKLLIVEDDPATRSGLTELVRTWGFTAEAAVDGVEAIEKLASFRPSIVISASRFGARPDARSAATGSTTRGITAYGDSSFLKYQVAGRGKSGDLALVLSSGQ